MPRFQVTLNYTQKVLDLFPLATFAGSIGGFLKLERSTIAVQTTQTTVNVGNNF